MSQKLSVSISRTHTPKEKSVQNLNNKLKAARQKPNREPTVLAEEKLYAIRARLVISMRKSPKRASSADECFENFYTKHHKIVTTATVKDSGISDFGGA